MKRTEIIDQLKDSRRSIATLIDQLDVILLALAEENVATQKRLHRAEAPERMSVARASKYLAISRGTMYKLIDEGAIPSLQCRPDSDRVIVRGSDLDRYVAGLPEQHRVRRNSLIPLERAS